MPAGTHLMPLWDITVRLVVVGSQPACRVSRRGRPPRPRLFAFVMASKVLQQQVMQLMQAAACSCQGECACAGQCTHVRGTSLRGHAGSALVVC